MNNEIKSLCNVYRDYFPIGAAVNKKLIKSHEGLLKKHFNSITAENDMKFIEIHPKENEFTFEKADLLLQFAKENNKKMRGHTLVWHNQTPDWVFSNEDGSTISKEDLLLRMKEHISKVVGHYRDDIYCWDVVNEAIDDKTSEFLRKTKWLEIIGEEYIEKAFLFAHEADPNAMLFYNDYNETNPEKRDKIIKLVKSLKAKDIPIHGIGLQGHWNIVTPTIDEIRESIERYAELGLKLQITEMDISVFEFDDHRADLSAPLEEMLEKQQKLYYDAFSLFREYKDVITGVTLWGVADDYTWLDNFPVIGRKNWPLLFDTHHNPKGSFWKVIDFN